MKIESQIEKISSFQHLELLANQVVEGFISGMHKSPFHGFSAEFAEHKVYNVGESTKHIDWKLFAKTDRLYAKRFEEETNLRCHIIIDNSSSMHYPKLKESQNFFENKIGFSVLASAVLMNLLKKQRDAVGLSVFSDTYEYYAPEKGSDRHHRMILNTLEGLLEKPVTKKNTDTITFLHQIAEKIHRRSMIILFTDMFQSGPESRSLDKGEEALFNALQHLKHNKHKVVLFHVVDNKTELNFDFDNAPRKFIDVETGEEVAIFADNVKEEYEKQVKIYFNKLALTCSQNQIKYIPVSVNESFKKVLMTYLVEKQSFG
ncbi:DUF58 domain-containing protein [Flavobacterium xueshanense]|uniref:DUF58 domain-containing protein n=1 Tax=Flavobacterium xueshanense TaxID=935223 RepID=A0A1I2AIU9_9FLAO|nr:DUF58 domain-containing protein [Flavobacterium xueshanense]SFE43964.1 Protein of unknown function DUF58 [Flavobacterium xueshanense]